MKDLLKLSAVASIRRTGKWMIFPLFLVGCGEEPSVMPAKEIIKPALTEIVSSRQADTLSFNGVVRAAERADLSFRVSGLVNELAVKEGDRVKKGQLLAKLDSRDAQTALASARLELKNVEAEYNRNKAIFEKSRAISKSQLDEVTTRFNLAKNRVNEAVRQLDYTEITSPFDGIIGQRFVDNYVQIQANEPVFTLHNLDDLEIVIHIPDKVMLSSNSGTEAKAEISAISGTLFDLNLRTYATQADPVSQTYSVVLGFQDLKGYRVLPGMVAKVLPKNNQNLNTVITLPVVAVVPDNLGKQYVWVVDEQNKVSKRIVEVGTLSLDRVEIKNGLNAGEQVVIAGVSSLKDGMQIRPMTHEGE